MRRAVGVISLVLAGLAVMMSCGGGGDSTGPSSGSGQPTTQTATVLNSYDRTILGSISLQGPMGSSVVVTPQMLRAAGVNLSSINTDFMVAYGAAEGGRLGNYIDNTLDGTLQVPITGSPVEIIGMNNRNGTDYGCIGLQFLLFPHGKDVTVRRLQAGKFDDFRVVGGDASAIAQGVRTVSRAVSVGGVSYGSATWAENDSSATIAGGLGSISDASSKTGYHDAHGHFVVRSGMPYRAIVGVTIVEFVEEWGGGNDMCGVRGPSIYVVPGQEDVIHPSGRDRIQYIALFSPKRR